MAFAEAMEKAGCPAGVFNLVNGEGPVAGEALASHPDVAMVSITGSTRAGAAVARAAAETVKRVTQELGGKSANLLLPGSDVAAKVARGVQVCFRNTGQSCTAPARILVPRADLPVAEEAARKAAEALRTGDPSAAGTDLGPVISAAQHARIQRYIELGIAEGAKLLTGGTGRPEGLNRGWYVRPTVFSEVTPAMTIAREEIFGPVLALIPYRDVDHAVEIANDTVYGLSNHVQGDPALALEVAKRLRSGQVLLNYPAYDAEAPFGGYGQSGNGREQGKWGIEEFLEIKAIVGAAAA
jgi:aldehyde dehydrogenase (NAD+)